MTFMGYVTRKECKYLCNFHVNMLVVEAAEAGPGHPSVCHTPPASSLLFCPTLLAQVFALPSKVGLCLAARLVCNLNLSLHRHKSPKLVSQWAPDCWIIGWFRRRWWAPTMIRRWWASLTNPTIMFQVGDCLVSSSHMSPPTAAPQYIQSVRRRC